MTSRQQLCDDDYETLAHFRSELRRFLRFSEEAAVQSGITAQQHQALLAIRAASRAELLIGELAEQLLLRPHSATELVNRLERIGFVRRQTDKEDARRVRVRLTAKGKRRLSSLAEEHRAELQRMKPMLDALLARL